LDLLLPPPTLYPSLLQWLCGCCLGCNGPIGGEELPCPPIIVLLKHDNRGSDDGRHHDGIQCPRLFLHPPPFPPPSVPCPTYVSFVVDFVLIAVPRPLSFPLPRQKSLGVLDCVEGGVLNSNPPRAAIAIATVNKSSCVLPSDKDSGSQLHGALLPPSPLSIMLESLPGGDRWAPKL
jgi:hypothetical protein